MPERPSRMDGQKLGLFSSQGKAECSWEALFLFYGGFYAGFYSMKLKPMVILFLINVDRRLYYFFSTLSL